MKTIIDALQRRYATKKFDTNKKIAQENMDILLESLRLSPSSFGLQPRKFIHVTTPEIRQKLQIASRGQAQITEASDLLVIAVKTTLQESDIDEYTESMRQTRAKNEADIAKIGEYKTTMLKTIAARTQEQLKAGNQKQAYIAMGVLLTTAAIMGIDACPMEGFDGKQYNEILGLNEFGLTATVAIPVGYRSPEDKYANLAKVRFEKEKILIKK